MKLTAAQISEIHEGLMLNDVLYDDVRIELADHIASDIESRMQTANESYPDAYVNAFKAWEDDLRPSTGGNWVSSRISAPAIIISVLESRLKHHILSAIVTGAAAMTVLCGIVYATYFDEQIQYFIFELIDVLAMIMFGSLIAARAATYYTPCKTTYRYIFKQQPIVYPILLGQIILMPEYMLETFFSAQSLLWGYRLFVLAFTFNALSVAVKHLRYSKNMKLI